MIATELVIEGPDEPIKFGSVAVERPTKEEGLPTSMAVAMAVACTGGC